MVLPGTSNGGGHMTLTAFHRDVRYGDGVFGGEAPHRASGYPRDETPIQDRTGSL
jgi:hypothetical protein